MYLYSVSNSSPSSFWISLCVGGGGVGPYYSTEIVLIKVPNDLHIVKLNCHYLDHVLFYSDLISFDMWTILTCFHHMASMAPNLPGLLPITLAALSLSTLLFLPSFPTSKDGSAPQLSPRSLFSICTYSLHDLIQSQHFKYHVTNKSSQDFISSPEIRLVHVMAYLTSPPECLISISNIPCLK